MLIFLICRFSVNSLACSIFQFQADFLFAEEGINVTTRFLTNFDLFDVWLVCRFVTFCMKNIEPFIESWKDNFFFTCQKAKNGVLDIPFWTIFFLHVDLTPEKRQTRQKEKFVIPTFFALPLNQRLPITFKTFEEPWLLAFWYPMHKLLVNVFENFQFFFVCRKFFLLKMTNDNLSRCCSFQRERERFHFLATKFG